MTRIEQGKVVRFSFSERLAHWLAALSFLYAGLTGLALWSPRLYWLASVFGGGATVRAWHPWGGVIFFAALGTMFVRWAGQMRLDREDRQWLGRAHRYAVHDESGLPEAGRFNAGQKALFWMQVCCTLLLLASGVALWFPSAVPQSLRLAAILIHPAVAVVSMAGIIVHIYMGTAAVPGAFRGMMQGWVTSGWARSHHPKWHREISKR
ncbi:MAG: formate dehydrogenase subunit gamma [Acidobacteriota bacterium]